MAVNKGLVEHKIDSNKEETATDEPQSLISKENDLVETIIESSNKEETATDEPIFEEYDRTHDTCFRLFFRVALLFGISIQPDDGKPTLYNVKMIWCYSTNILKALIFIPAFVHLSELLPENKMEVPVRAMFFSTYAATLEMLCNRKVIYKACNQITRIHQQLLPGENIGSKYVHLQLTLVMIFMVTHTSLTLFVAFISHWEMYLNNVQVPFIASETFHYRYVGVVITCTTASFIRDFCVCLILLCMYQSVFSAASEVVNAYGRKLKETTSGDRNSLSIEQKTSEFRDICETVQLIDDAFSGTVFFLLGVNISMFLSAFSLVISKYFIHPADYALSFVFFLVSYVMLLFITRSAAKVRVSHLELKATLLDTVNDMADLANEDVFQKYMLLTNNILAAKMGISAGGMYGIKKSIFWDVAQLLIDYCLILKKLD